MFEVHIYAPVVGSLKVVWIIQFGNETKKNMARGPLLIGKKFKQIHGYLLNKHFTSCAWTMCIWQWTRSSNWSKQMKTKSVSLCMQEHSSYIDSWNQNEKGAWDPWLWGSKVLLNLKSQMVGGVAPTKFLGCDLVPPPQLNNYIFIIFIH